MVSKLSSHFFKSWSCRAAHFLHKIWVHGMCKIINNRFKIFHWIWLNSKYMVHGVTPEKKSRGFRSGLFGGQGVPVLLEIRRQHGKKKIFADFTKFFWKAIKCLFVDGFSKSKNHKKWANLKNKFIFGVCKDHRESKIEW